MGRPPVARGGSNMPVHVDEVAHRRQACQVPTLSQDLSVLRIPFTDSPLSSRTHTQARHGGTEPLLFTPDAQKHHAINKTLTIHTLA